MLPSISRGEVRGKVVKNLEFYIVIILFLIIFVISFMLLQNLYYDYDESFNLQIPKNLVEKGQYATYYNLEYHLFDPAITTGPSVLIPIAIFFKIFGTNYLVSRFVMLCFFILMCLFLYIVSREFFGRKAAYLSLIFVILIPGSLTIGLRALGEIPAVLYLLIGIYFLCVYEKQNDKKIILLFFSGVFFAFSVLAKLLFFIVLFPIVLYIIFQKERWKTKVTLPASFLSTLFIWEAYQIGALGTDKYMDLKVKTYYVLTTHGASTKVVTEILMSKIYFLGNIFGVRIELLLAIVAIFAVFCIFLLIDGFLKKKLSLVGYISFTGLSVVFWFLFIYRIYFRHILPYLILCISLFSYMVTKLFDNFRNLKGTKNKKLLFIMLLAIVTFSAIFLTLHATTKKMNDYVGQKSFLETQKDFIQEINRKIPSNSKIGYLGWWRAPEISYFVENDFLDLSGLNSLVVFKGKRLSPDFVLVTPYQISLDPASLELLKPFLGDVVIKACCEKGCYILYKYREGWEETLGGVRWISNYARIIIDSQEEQESNLHLELTSFHRPRTLQCYLNGKMIHELKIPPKFVKLEIPIKLKKGKNVIGFHTPDGCQRPCDFPELKNPDARCLSFAFCNITIN